MKTVKVLFLTAVLAAPLSALAREGSYFYAGVGLGDFTLRIDDADDFGQDFDQSDLSWKIFGGWNFNKYFGFEVAWVDFGQTDQELDLDDGDGGAIPVDTRIEVDGIETYLTATLPFEMFQVYGKGGYLWYDTEVTLDDGIDRLRASDSDGSWAWAFGVGIVLFDKIPINVEYEVLDVQDVDKSEAWWLTAGWRF